MATRRKELKDDDLAWLRPRSKEWNAAWALMAEWTGDPDREALDEESGQVWQYMGTHRPRGEWLHSFRHREHPREGRWVLNVPASKGWKPAMEKPRSVSRRRISAERESPLTPALSPRRRTQRESAVSA